MDNSEISILRSDNCRHCSFIGGGEYDYCPCCNLNYGGAKYPDIESEIEIAEKNILLKCLSVSFANISIGDGMTIHEANLEGAYFDDNVRITARKKDNEVSWEEIPDWKIENMYTSLWFMDQKGFHFYFPAFLKWSLLNGHTTETIAFDNTLALIDIIKYRSNIKMFDLFNKDQVNLIIEYIKFIIKYYNNINLNELTVKAWESLRDRRFC